MSNWIFIVFACYAITFVIVNGDILHKIRSKFISLTPFLRVNNMHMLECRMCIGFWVSLLVSIATTDTSDILLFILMWLSYYGASYFLATQER